MTKFNSNRSATLRKILRISSSGKSTDKVSRPAESLPVFTAVPPLPASSLIVTVSEPAAVGVVEVVAAASWADALYAPTEKATARARASFLVLITAFWFGNNGERKFSFV